MIKSLILFVSFISLIFITQNLSGQVLIPDQKIQEIRDEKQEILSLSLTDETALDSTVYYSYDSESDSVRLLKKTTDQGGSVNFETRYEFIWMDDQWINLTKHEITLNESDQLILSEYFNWDRDLSEWIDYISITITYDENGYDDLYTYLRWNVELNRWDNYYKDDSDYDSNGNLLQYIEWLGNDLNEWEYYYKEINTYNTDGSLNDSYIAFWNSDISEWENYHKEEFYYHESGLTNYRLYYRWMTGDWRLSLKTDYFYTDSEHYDYLTTYQRIEDEWVLSYQREFSYDENYNETLLLDLRWVNDMWANDQKYDFEYDQNNNRTLYLFSVWDEGNSTWVPQIKYEYLYDEMNNRLMILAVHWSVDEMKWIGNYFEEFFYDDDFKQLIDIFYGWDDVNGGWYLDEKTFYYRSIILQSPELIAHSISVYPNPVEDVLTIKTPDGEYSDLVIISLSGRQIEKVKLSGLETRINLENYAPGIYFLQLKAGNEIVSKKIVKQ